MATPNQNTREAEAAVSEADAEQVVVDRHDETPGPDVDPRYDIVDTITVDDAAGLVDAWARYRYPTNEHTDLESGVIAMDGWSVVGQQHADGSGIIHAPERLDVFALRSPEGIVITNDDRSLMWPDDSDAADEVDSHGFSFEFVGDVIEEQTDLDTDRDGRPWLDELTVAPDTTRVDGEDVMRDVVAVDVLPPDHPDDGVLLTHRTGVQVYIGHDSTWWDDNDVFGFVLEQEYRAPSASDTISLLKPTDVAAAEQDGKDVRRQGEWYLVPADEVPAGTIQRPGVGSRPYGGSPLGSHVPREWATGVPDDEFVAKFHDEIDANVTAETPQAVVEALGSWSVRRQTSFADLREMAGGIYVRGSLRHRDREHEMETVDGWHRARTHDRDVLTIDTTTNRVQID